jgi:hypothetical protein
MLHLPSTELQDFREPPSEQIHFSLVVVHEMGQQEESSVEKYLVASSGVVYLKRPVRSQLWVKQLVPVVLASHWRAIQIGRRSIGVFHSHGNPRYGWFIVRNPKQKWMI